MGSYTAASSTAAALAAAGAPTTHPVKAMTHNPQAEGKNNSMNEEALMLSCAAVRRCLRHGSSSTNTGMRANPSIHRLLTTAVELTCSQDLQSQQLSMHINQLL